MARGRKLTPGLSPLHFFGSEVRRAREAAGMTQGDLAAMVPFDLSMVSRIEHGISAPDRHFAQVCDEAFPSSGGWFTRFYDESRDWNPPFADAFRPFAEYEAEATVLYVFENTVIPGLLQTEEYAHEVLSRHPGVTDGQATERIAARIARKDVLTCDNPPLAWFVLDVVALHREIGGRKVMYKVVRHISEMASLPNVSIQVLTSSAHVGLQGAVNIAETVGASTVASLEDLADGRIVDDTTTVSLLATRFRHLQTEALSAADSLTLIEQIAEERYGELGPPLA
jgi:transcriptional regulator with XRE-family HTH domain